MGLGHYIKDLSTVSNKPPQLWFSFLSNFLICHCCCVFRANASLFTYNKNSVRIFILVYGWLHHCQFVTNNIPHSVSSVISKLKYEFALNEPRTFTLLSSGGGHSHLLIGLPFTYTKLAWPTASLSTLPLLHQANSPNIVGQTTNLVHWLDVDWVCCVDCCHST